MYSKVRRVSEFVLYEMGIYTNEEKGKRRREKKEKNVGEALAVACERRHGLQLGSAGSKSPGTWQRLEKKVQVKDGLTAFASALWRLCLKGRDERGFCDSELGAKKRGGRGGGKDGQENVLIHLSVCLCHVGRLALLFWCLLGVVG